MKDSSKDKSVPVDMFMMLAEDAKAVNIYAGMSSAGQQFLLERFAKAGSREEEKSIIDELKK